MSFLARLFGGKAAKALTPAELREQLFAAAAAGSDALSELCHAHREAIPLAYASWTTVPVEIRADQRAVKHYMTGLIAVGQFFATQLGDSSLLQRLMPPGRANPLVRWQGQLAEARELIASSDFAEAESLLVAAVEAARGLTGTGVDRLLPQTLGALGQCLFQQGHADRALDPMTRALELCREQGDVEGVRAYLGNSYEVCRYLGDGEAAAKHAESLASMLESAGDKRGAARFRSRAALARAGEPRNRIVVEFDGQQYEVAELPDAVYEGRHNVKFVFERNRLTLRPALELIRKAEALAAEAEYERALTVFRAAAAADPHAPEAHFLAGLTLLHLRRPAEAAASYEACEVRAPGWFVCRADLWLAQQLVGARYDHGAFLALNALEGNRPAGEQEARARRSLERYPDLAGLHLELGKALSKLDRIDAAESAYRDGLRCAEDPDTRTRLLTALGALGALGNQITADREQVLRQAVELQGNLVSAAQASFLLRAARAN